MVLRSGLLVLCFVGMSSDWHDVCSDWHMLFAILRHIINIANKAEDKNSASEDHTLACGACLNANTRAPGQGVLRFTDLGVVAHGVHDVCHEMMSSATHAVPATALLSPHTLLLHKDLSSCFAPCYGSCEAPQGALGCKGAVES